MKVLGLNDQCCGIIINLYIDCHNYMVTALFFGLIKTAKIKIENLKKSFAAGYLERCEP